VHGYKEEGTTTTPFRMLTANGKLEEKMFSYCKTKY
jgi:phosphoketolase